MILKSLSDEALLSSLSTVCVELRGLVARLLLHLNEVEDRDIHLRSACSSMWDFCQRRLGMSKAAAYRRVDAARLVRKFPTLLAYVERGDVNLTTLLLLRDHFTDRNLDELVEGAKGKNTRQVEEMIAALAPRPDVFATITPLPPTAPLMAGA